MKGRNIALLFAAAVSVLPGLSAAQGMQVTHESSKGFVMNTYWSAPGKTAFFKVTESTRLNGGPVESSSASGYALISTATGFVAYVSDPGDTTASVIPTNTAFRSPASGSGGFPARRMEYAFGPFGLRLVSMTAGTILAESTLENPTLIQMSRQPYHNVLSLPGIGVLFAINSVYSGKFAFNPTGTGGMAFVANSGAVETIVPSGSAVDPASWMGHFHSVESEVIRP